MKQFVVLFLTIGGVFGVRAQTPLHITTGKTTSLVFPFPIRHVDRGTRDVLIQQVKEADHILLMKAASENFPETNVTVITSDGGIYDFTVNYEDRPKSFVYNLPSQSSASLSGYANSLLTNPRTMRGISQRKFDMRAVISGIYIKGNYIFYQLQLQNQGTPDYDIDFLRFYIRDQRINKRTAVQENELKPLYLAGNVSSVKASSRSVIVVALEKFTLPDAKFLAIEINEKNGGRNLLLKVKNRKIIRAKALPDLH